MSSAWSDDLSTGIVEIDVEHRELFSKVAMLEEAARRGDPNGTQVILKFLEQYSQGHFAHEERWMESTGYPWLAEHRLAHERFVEELRERKDRYLTNRSLAMLTLELCDWMEVWLSGHVLGADAEMARHIRAAGY